MRKRSFLPFIVTAILLLLPLFSKFLANELRPALIFTIAALGLNALVGYTGLLNLGMAAFMALGAYAYAVMTCEIYPFQLGFWGGAIFAIIFSALFGFILGIPTLRLRGDYLAIVTLGFGEIVQDSLKNLQSITKGTQGINPLPSPTFGLIQLSTSQVYYWYYFLVVILLVVLFLLTNLERSRIGRVFTALREDQLVTGCLGVSTVKIKLTAFVLCAALGGLSGALWASSLGSSGDPGNYDFQISIIILCSVIVGGIGNIWGVVLGVILMMGLNSIILNAFGLGADLKYLVFGLALVLTMRLKPSGLFARLEGQTCPTKATV